MESEWFDIVLHFISNFIGIIIILYNINDHTELTGIFCHSMTVRTWNSIEDGFVKFLE